jgi:UDP-glucose 4-epimerase
MVFRRLSEGRAPLIFGDDLPTPDGTCIRDFIHVSDIASAHIAAARALADGRLDALTANVGRGEGVSVREMIAAIREVTGTAHEDWAEPVVVARRPGDAPRVVAAAGTIRSALGWTAQHGLQDMVSSAWDGWTARVAAATASGSCPAARTHSEDDHAEHQLSAAPLVAGEGQ